MNSTSLYFMPLSSYCWVCKEDFKTGDIVEIGQESKDGFSLEAYHVECRKGAWHGLSSEECRAHTGCEVEGCRILTQLPHNHEVEI